MHLDERSEGDYRIYVGALEAPQGGGYEASVVIYRTRGARVGTVEVEQSLLGRLLGYGTIVAGDRPRGVESSGYRTRLTVSARIRSRASSRWAIAPWRSPRGPRTPSACPGTPWPVRRRAPTSAVRARS